MGARRLIAPAGALLAAIAIVGCGSEDFKNEPRPPVPIELGARIGQDGVSISPSSSDHIGAGEATITISNQTNEPARLVLDGPTDASSTEIVAQGTGSVTTVLKEGRYTVTNGGDGPETRLEVGPARASSQNVLLLP